MVRKKDLINPFLSCLFLVGVALLIGFQSSAFSGFPKGYDAFDHLALGEIIKRNFPYVFWNPYWDGGVVLFPRNYPPLFHFGVGILGKFFSLETTLITRYFLILSIILIVIFIFLTIFALTKKSTFGLFSGLFFLASSTVWCYILSEGLYSRVLAMMTVSFVIFCLTLNYFKPSFWRFLLLIFSLVLSYLAHFLSAFLSSSSFLVFLIFLRKERFLEKIVWGLKVFLPVWGLTAFFYLPVFLGGGGELGFLGRFEAEEYEPWSFLNLFKQGYPGLPFLSLPLGLVFLIVVFLLRYKIKSNEKRVIFKFFILFGILAFLSLFYVLGAYKHYFFYGIYPGQFLLPAVFYFALFLGLGIYFLEELEVLRKEVFWLGITGILALSLIQIPNLKKITIDQSKIYPRLTFKGIDKRNLFRFAHKEEVLGGAFNFYSQTLQTRGYWEPGILNRKFHDLFEKEVFLTSGNLKETKFWLDWYGVKGIFLASRNIEREGDFSIWRKFSENKEDFARVEGGEFDYKGVAPVIIGTKAPIFLVKEDGRYFEFLNLLSKEGIDSKSLIPIKSKTAKKEDFSAWVLDSLEEVDKIENLDLEGQFSWFVNSQKREIELKEYYPGVLLKESYFRNWQAKIIEEGKKERKLLIYFAGPGMMYVSLPKNYSLPARVVFEYRFGFWEKMGLAVSVFTLLILIFRGFSLKFSYGKKIKT